MSQRRIRKGFFAVSAVLIISVFFVSGCVQRKLTINTTPTEAMVLLNDEEIGISPVTVGFEWYGDYNVTISKPGFETLKTHRKLDRPTHDKFPFDLFYDLFGSNRMDSYEWTFELAPQKAVEREVLIDSAQNLRTETAAELAKPTAEDKK